MTTFFHLQVTCKDPKTAQALRVYNWDDSWELREGITIGNDYPDDVEYRMNPDYPDSLILPDFLDTIGRNFVVSQRVREFLETLNLENLQFLPVSVVDHKGRQRTEKFYHVNITQLTDGIDQDATTFNWNELDDTLMCDVSNLTLITDRFKGVRLGRLKYLPNVLFVDAELATDLMNQGFTEVECVNFSKCEAEVGMPLGDVKWT